MSTAPYGDDDRRRQIESRRRERQQLEARRARRRRIRIRTAVAVGAVAAIVAAVALIFGASHSASRARTVHRAFRPRPSADDLAVNRVLAYTPFVTGGGATRREVALTFDDGPGPYTRRLLSTLKRLNAPATFFTVGFLGRWFLSATSAAVDAGFVVGDHTERHRMLAWLSRAGQRDEIVTQTEWVRKAGGPFPRLFRPPYGSFNRTTLAELRRLRMLMVLWSVDTDDYRRPGVAVIVARALSGAKPGAIILMHDGGGGRIQTLEALPTIVNALRRRGYRLVTVPQLLRDDPPPAGQRLPRSLVGG